MDTMSPQGTIGQSRSVSLTGESRVSALPDNKKKMKSLAQRRQSAPSLVISKALTKSRSMSRENCVSPVSPESCPLVTSFLAPCRAFLGHAHAQLKTGLQVQDRHLFLFTDTLLITKAKSSTHFKLKARVRVCEMWTGSCMDEVCEGSTSPDRSMVMGWPTFNCVATFGSLEHKERFFSLIRSRITEEKEKDDPKTVPLKIFAKDIGNCAYAKTLAVSNSDSTIDVIRMALQQFGISGCVEDHQLWVTSCKDDSPYPLIGHESPFSIKMSHIRDRTGKRGGAKDCGGPPDSQGALLLDQCLQGVLMLDQSLPPDTQVHFILRPSGVASPQAPLTEPGQKVLKRKRSLLNWAFWKGSSSQLDGAPLSPSSLPPTSGRLFGRQLSAVCPPDHTLPKPVMDMLAVLAQEGPYTRGIFRRSAGVKACRELRDRLDTSDDTPLTHQSVFVIAAVFKDFLRNIPGSLLCVDLYEQWVWVMEREEEERTHTIHRLLQLLPSENRLLLCHLVAVLNGIQDNAEDNQMNAFNLSVCIAPSMLWAPHATTPQEEGEGTKKVCELVRFIIHNCRKVLGEDVTSLFGGFPQKGSSSDHGSDVSSFQTNDSSYDSLENELNDDPDSPFQAPPPLLRDKATPDSRSRDSVITLSDGDPDPTDILQLPPLARPRKFTPVAARHQPRFPRQPGAQLQQGPRRLRRSSEPALGHAPSGLAVHLEKASRKASYDAAMEGEEEEEEEEDDEVFLEQRMRTLQLAEGGGAEKGGSGSGLRRKAKHYAPLPPLRLDASCSSLSSPATSPTGSSLSSLDSAFSQYSTDYTVAVGFPVVSTEPPAPTPLRSPPGPPPSAGSPPQANAHSESTTPPRHAPSHPHSLHPNTWLKRDRRLSLRQPDNRHSEEAAAEVKGAKSQGGGAREAGPSPRRRSSSPPSYQQAVAHSPFYKGSSDRQLTIRELRLLHHQPCGITPAAKPPPTGSNTAQRSSPTGSEPPQGVFYGQSSSTLVLQRSKPHPQLPLTASEGVGRRPLTLPRRASEPIMMTTADLGLVRTCRASRGSPPLESGLRVSDVEPHSSVGPVGEQNYSLSPSASRALRDYFSMHGETDADACLRRRQQVALAIVQGKRAWQSRRCSDPRLDDFDQIFFAEESYV